GRRLTGPAEGRQAPPSRGGGADGLRDHERVPAGQVQELQRGGPGLRRPRPGPLPRERLPAARHPRGRAPRHPLQRHHHPRPPPPPVLESIALEERGLILVTGTTGSGKSTTLAAMIDHINANETDHIMTIEDPIEFLIRDKRSIVNQREVGVDTISFSQALKS